MRRRSLAAWRKLRPILRIPASDSDLDDEVNALLTEDGLAFETEGGDVLEVEE